MRKFNSMQRFSLHTCVAVTFVELLKDIPMIPVAALLLVLGPWRIFNLFTIFFSQVNRVPTNAQRKYRITSRRLEIFNILFTVITYDYPCLLLTIILIGSIYKIFAVLRIYVNGLIKLCSKVGETLINYIKQFSFIG